MGVDDVIYQRSTDFLIFALVICAVLAVFLNFYWKTLAVPTVKSVLDLNAYQFTQPVRDASEHRALLFNERIGFNGSFGRRYILYRLHSLLIPVLIMAFLNLHFGPTYISYGITLIRSSIDGYATSWPSPSDILFPSVAKCEIASLWVEPGSHKFGVEVESALCQIHLNGIFRNLFFFVWWCLVLLLISGFLEFVSLMRYFSNSYRGRVCRKYLAKVCDIEGSEAMKYRALPTGEEKFHSLDEVIQVEIDYGDWVLLHFLKKNLSGLQFRNFMWSVANPEYRLPFQGGFRIRTAQEMAVERLKKKEKQLEKIGTLQGKFSSIPLTIEVTNKAFQVCNTLAEKPESIFQEIRKHGPSPSALLDDKTPISARKVLPSLSDWWD